MADYFRFSCPQCGQRLKAKREAVGRKAHCKRCGAEFDVPNPATSQHDPATPRTPGASVAAAETDPAPMVLKDQTSANYEPAPPRGGPTPLSNQRKGCGRALGLAGLTIVVGCAVFGVAGYGIGGKASGTNGWPVETTASPLRRPSDVPHQKHALAQPPPPRPKSVSKPKPSPRAPTGGGQ